MTGIVLVTHDGLGESMRHQAEVILDRPLDLVSVAISPAVDPDAAFDEVLAAIAAGSDPGGTIVLTDLPGATPHNVAVRAAEIRRAPVISGLNLPMLLKVVNHAAEDPEKLAELAREGGIQGIMKR